MTRSKLLTVSPLTKISLISKSVNDTHIRYQADKNRYYTLILAKRPRSDVETDSDMGTELNNSIRSTPTFSIYHFELFYWFFLSIMFPKLNFFWYLNSNILIIYDGQLFCPSESTRKSNFIQTADNITLMEWYVNDIHQMLLFIHHLCHPHRSYISFAFY